jgi:hypothetical protein
MQDLLIQDLSMLVYGCLVRSGRLPAMGYRRVTSTDSCLPDQDVTSNVIDYPMMVTLQNELCRMRILGKGDFREDVKQ